MTDRSDRLTPGQPISAKVVALLAERAERLINQDAAAPLARAVLGGIGPIVSDDRLPTIPARLSGDGPGFDWAEVYPSGGGTWTELAGGRSGTGNAYELNNRTGLNGVVFLTFSAGNDYRFPYPMSNVANTTIQGAIRGCFSTRSVAGVTNGVSGSTVTVMDGGGTVLGTTTSGTNGSYSVPIYLAGATAITVTATPSSSRQVAGSYTTSVAPGGTYLVDVQLTPAADYQCFSRRCPLPWKTTLTLDSTGDCQGTSYPSDTLTYTVRPAWVTGFSFLNSPPSNGWIGATPFTVFGSGLNDWLYYYDQGNAMTAIANRLYAISQVGNRGLIIANDLNFIGVTDCAVFTVTQTCNDETFIGFTIHE